MKNLSNLLLLTTSSLALGYENENGWKKTADGALETDADGNPIYIGSDGKESTIAPGYINRLNTEAASHRARANEAETKLKAFGDLDPKKAKEAIEKMKDVNLDELVNKGEIESVRTQMRERFETEIAERDKTIAERDEKLNKLALDNAFNSSEFLKERIALPIDAARATFRDRFKVEDGQVIPLNETGEPLINKHGQVASVDEAFEAFVSARQDKDVWLKAPPVGGSGSQGGGGGHGGGNRMKRADYDALSPMEQAAIGKKAAKGEIEIVD